MPSDYYSEEASHFRIVVFRHWVNHCGANPFAMRVGGDESNISLFLDPRNRDLGASKLAALEELELFWNLVNQKIQKIMAILLHP